MAPALISSSSAASPPVTKNGGFEALESGDGQVLYYVKDRKEPGLWRIPPNGGSEAQACKDVREGTWTVARDSIYFIDPVLVEKRSKKLKRCDPKTGRAWPIAHVEKP